MLEKAFSNQYLLTNDVSQKIYHEIKGLPIIDLHSHIEASWLLENRKWDNIWSAWASTDHYVWELMRRFGVPEDKITGPAPDEEKWLAFASIVPLLIGNPLYDWLHLDLKLFFGLDEQVSANTAHKIWVATKEKLSTTPELQPRGILKAANVKVLCTTDSPLSTLEAHKRLSDELSEIQILPTWRPDPLFEIGTAGWRENIHALGNVTGLDVSKFKGFIDALAKTHKYFELHGCRSSDHALEDPLLDFSNRKTIERVYVRALQGGKITEEEKARFRSVCLYLSGELNAESKWFMQLHIGAVRDYRQQLFLKLGKDSGGDVATHMNEITKGLRKFLNYFDGRLTIILYVLHPSHVYTVATIARAFPRVYLGAPWWFMDNPFHMHNYLAELAAVDTLSLFPGMVSDSRKMLSLVSRHDLFRRVLANFLGELVQNRRAHLEEAIAVASRATYENPYHLVKEGII
jgi:glucuronate isomerase